MGFKHTFRQWRDLVPLVNEWGTSYFEHEDNTTNSTAVSMVVLSSQGFDVSSAIVAVSAV